MPTPIQHTRGGCRRIVTAITAAAALFAAGLAVAAEPLPPVTVYKSPTCGCCIAWVEHLEENGFTVNVVNQRDVVPDKVHFGVPEPLYSCHTARVDGYTVEGHVPAADIKRLIEERPAVSGIAVPGMPQGSPGMETGHVESYSVISYTEDGVTAEFSRY